MGAGGGSTEERRICVGQGAFRYQALVGWEQLPAGWSLVEVAGVATDSAGNVFVFNRGAHPLIVFDRQGRFLRSWGEGGFTRPHGILIGPDDAVYCVDDADHTVRKFTPDGRPLLVLGTAGQPSDTGARTVDYRTIARAGAPFNFPTNLALSPAGDIYVADGYGNARVHHFDPRGRLLRSWGSRVRFQDNFMCRTASRVDRRGTVYVADRENSRIQLFSPDGEYLAEWTGVARPCLVPIEGQDQVFVAELGYRAGMFEGNRPPAGHSTGGRVSVFNARGELQSRWGGGDNPCAAGDFFAPHDITLDRFGDVYVGEVTMSAGGRRGLVASDCHTLQKFVRIHAQETA